MTIEEQNESLEKYKKIQSTDILNSKKRMIWEYFRKLTDVSNLENNIKSEFSLYLAPLRQIKNTKIPILTIEQNKELYIDEEFAKSNPIITNIHLTRETIHELSSFINGEQYFFGHKHNGSETLKFMGLDEVTAQMFAEDIEQIRLDKNSDYLYIAKNVMRVMKVLFGEDTLASQFVNNDNKFEEQFNLTTDYNFESFASLINDLCLLNQNEKYGGLTEQDMSLLLIKQDHLLNFTSYLVSQFSKGNSNIYHDISNELNDEYFEEKIGIDSLNKIKLH